MPEAEIRLWMQLRKSQIDGYKFRRQQGIIYYIVDFYCPEDRLVIELDGDSHFEPGAKEKDAKRDARLLSLGIIVLRFTNQDIYHGMEMVLEKIRDTLRQRG